VIDQLELKHFKCFEKLNLPIKPLTLLSGPNGSGKSSVIQALALLHQTMRDHEWSTRLMLNGSAIKLGTVSDIVDKVHGRNTFGIGISDDGDKYEWTFRGDRSEMSMVIGRVTANSTIIGEPQMLQHLLPRKTTQSGQAEAWASWPIADRIRRLTYLSAERAGPREVYALADLQMAPVVGPAGEHAASVLHLGRDEHVLGELAIGAPMTRLRQVQERMRVFFPGCSITLEPVSQTNAVTLGFRMSDETDFHRPINVGFGLTQVLPIIVASLSAFRQDIILIENPEVHLHPAGQAQMGMFLGEVAQAGVQVIVETHSDHVLNGVRRSVRAGKLPARNVAIHFFRPRSEGTAQVVSPQMDDTGNIDSWPDGFFDQFDKDTNYFAGWGA
jgi:predicted ATPase